MGPSPNLMPSGNFVGPECHKSKFYFHLIPVINLTSLQTATLRLFPRCYAIAMDSLLNRKRIRGFLCVPVSFSSLFLFTFILHWHLTIITESSSSRPAAASVEIWFLHSLHLCGAVASSMWNITPCWGVIWANSNNLVMLLCGIVLSSLFFNIFHCLRLTLAQVRYSVLALARLEEVYLGTVGLL